MNIKQSQSMHKTLSFVSLSYVPIHYMDYPRYCTRATSAILPRCFSHCANQYLSFHTIISATLVRFCYLAPPTGMEGESQENVFRFRTDANIQNFASDCKTFSDFFMTDTAGNVFQAQKWKRRRRRKQVFVTNRKDGDDDRNKKPS